MTEKGFKSEQKGNGDTVKNSTIGVNSVVKGRHLILKCTKRESIQLTY